MSAETQLPDMILDVAGRLAADEYLADVFVTHERKGDIAQDVANALGVFNSSGGKTGACLIVLSPVGTDDLPDATFGPLGVALTVLVLEDPVINDTPASGSGKPALALARRVHRILKHYRAAGLSHALVPEKNCIVPVESKAAPVAYEVRFSATEADPVIYQKVIWPSIAPASGPAPQTVTLASPTPGAALYYTLDGSHPWEGNPNAMLYSTPFALTAPATLRVCAFKAGWVASDCNSAAYT